MQVVVVELLVESSRWKSPVVLGIVVVEVRRCKVVPEVPVLYLVVQVVVVVVHRCCPVAVALSRR